MLYKGFYGDSAFMVNYIKCPRCELNYIDSEKQEYCDVCIAEMKGNRLQFADLDDDDLEEIDSELESEEICPVCGLNPVAPGEKMCESCRREKEYEEDDVDIDKDEEWKNYLDEDDSELSEEETELDAELKAELEEEEEEEEDEMYHGEDDGFENEDVDSLDDLEDDDFDDEEDYDDEDDEDDEDDF